MAVTKCFIYFSNRANQGFKTETVAKILGLRFDSETKTLRTLRDVKVAKIENCQGRPGFFYFTLYDGKKNRKFFDVIEEENRFEVCCSRQEQPEMFDSSPAKAPWSRGQSNRGMCLA